MGWAGHSSHESWSSSGDLAGDMVTGEQIFKCCKIHGDEELQPNVQ